MLSVQISDIKPFMKELLMKDTFDGYQMIQGTVTTYNTIDVDGHVHGEFFGTDLDTTELAGCEYTPWKQSRELFLTLIRGKYTPLSFRFTLCPNPSVQSQILSGIPSGERENIKSLLLNIRFDEHGLYVMTGVSTQVFSMDRSAGEAWDEYARKFLSAWEA